MEKMNLTLPLYIIISGDNLADLSEKVNSYLVDYNYKPTGGITQMISKSYPVARNFITGEVTVIIPESTQLIQALVRKDVS